MHAVTLRTEEHSLVNVFSLRQPQANSHTTRKDQGQVGADEVGSILIIIIIHHVVTTPDSRNSGVKSSSSKLLYNLAWRDAHARTTQSHT